MKHILTTLLCLFLNINRVNAEERYCSTTFTWSLYNISCITDNMDYITCAITTNPIWRVDNFTQGYLEHGPSQPPVSKWQSITNLIGEYERKQDISVEGMGTNLLQGCTFDDTIIGRQYWASWRMVGLNGYTSSWLEAITFIPNLEYPNPPILFRIFPFLE